MYSQAAEPSSPADGTMWWTGSALKQWMNSKWRVIEATLPPVWYGDRALVLGGQSSSSLDVIDYYSLSTLGNAVDFGNMTLARQHQASCSSGTVVFTGGGITGSNYRNVIDKVVVATAGNAVDSGDLIQSRIRLCSAANGIYGIWSTGYSDHNNYRYDKSEYVVLATGGNGVNHGYAYYIVPPGDSGAGYGSYLQMMDSTMWGDKDKFIMAGGDKAGAPYLDIMASARYDTPANSTYFGKLTQSRHEAASGGSATKMVIGSGYLLGTTNAVYNVIDYVSMATAASATVFGALTTTIFNHGPNLTSDAVKCCWNGGRASVGYARINTIQYVTIEVSSNTSDFGDLSVARSQTSGGSGT
tara:strand:- start:1017 stop:2087 length:1071 start_codon:yes stop_codon:yes gene_type:complete